MFGDIFKTMIQNSSRLLEWIKIHLYVLSICYLIGFTPTILQMKKSTSRFVVEGTTTKDAPRTVWDWLSLEKNSRGLFASNLIICMTSSTFGTYVKFGLRLTVKCLNKYNYAKSQIPSDKTFHKLASHIKSH